MAGSLQRLVGALGLLLLLSGAPAGAHLPVAVGGEPLPTLAPMLERATPAVVLPVPAGPTRKSLHSNGALTTLCCSADSC